MSTFLRALKNTSILISKHKGSGDGKRDLGLHSCYFPSHFRFLSATRNKTMAFIFLSQGALRGDMCWAWKKRAAALLLFWQTAFDSHDVGVAGAEPFPSKVPLCTEGDLQQREEPSPSLLLSDTASIPCSHPSSNVTTAVPVDAYFWQLSLKDNKETGTEVLLGHLGDLFGPQAWKLSFPLRQCSRITFQLQKYKKQDFYCYVSKDSYFQIRQGTSLIRWNTFCKLESFPSSLWHLSHSAVSVLPSSQ